MAHKQQQELEVRLANISATGQASNPLVVALKQQLALTSHDLGLAAGELRELEQRYLDARKYLVQLHPGEFVGTGCICGIPLVCLCVCKCCQQLATANVCCDTL